MDTIEAKLDAARQELLDLSLRNKLLNYRTLQSKGVEVVDELAEEVYRALVTNAVAMTFLAVPEKDENTSGPNDQDTDPAQVPPPNPAGTVLAQPEDAEIGISNRHLDKHLQTPHISTNLQKRLLNSYYAARTYIEEQGVNVLYLAVGMLTWYESPNSDIMRQAPLILIPVELFRTSAQTRFQIKYTGDEIGENLSLRTKLKADYGINLPEFSNSDELDVHSYFSQVETAIRYQSRWGITRNTMALSFFSFGTFLLYNDLDPDNWPDDRAPGKHPLLNALFQSSFSEPPALIEDGDHLDQHVSPKESFHVVDADSSQTLAILDVKHGRNLVIQGPPGTGKSQTITNLLAEALAQKKTVLFVAEKMAALEVVKRRLDETGLGVACLELHSHKTNKKAFLEELERTLQLGRPKKQDASADLRSLVDNRDRLNAYSTAVNTPVGETQTTPYHAYGQLLRLNKELDNIGSLPNVELPIMNSWSGMTFQQWNERIEELQTLLKRIGVPVQHPFWGSLHKSFLPANRRAIQASCEETARSVDSLQKQAYQLSHQLSLSRPTQRQDVIQLNEVGKIILQSPDLTAIRVKDAAWVGKTSSIKQGLVFGAKISALHEKFDQWLLPEAWEQDVLELRGVYVSYGNKWWRVFSRTFRQARQKLAGITRKGLPEKVEEQLALIDAIIESQRLQENFMRYQPLLDHLFQERVQRSDSDWAELATITDWIVQLYGQIKWGTVPEEILQCLGMPLQRETLQSLVGAIEKLLEQHVKTIAELIKAVKLDEERRFGPGKQFATLPFSNQQKVLYRWYKETDRLQEMVRFNHLVTAFKDSQLSPILLLASQWPDADKYLVPLFRRTWFEIVLKKAVSANPVLPRFDGKTHEHHIRNFRQADELSFHINRTELALKHWEQLPRYSGGGQLGILYREFAKKRRHSPIRKLMTDAGYAVQTIKPIFMMSPLSVAMFLPPEAIQFDLIIFDEASQVRPVEAIGAILRGKQCVVVGDSRQLPPTTFFNQILEAEDEEESPTADLESVLSLFSAQGAPQRMLRWHYRSRHESLIAVSNYEFYENRLVIFPSPDSHKEEAGLVLHHLPNTVYDRGGSRSNLEEARVVAEAVLEHARTRSHLTLGVAAFSINQTLAIQDQLEILRRQNPDLEPFFNSHPTEPFFVKNLENIQGDERDVIFISVGYGRSEDGHFTMNFGPLNKEGGERRLNVLITRARLRCEIFTNFTDEDIDLNRTNARGVIALKRFLKFARTDHLDVPSNTQRDPDSIFEEQVAKALRQVGHEVVHQIGSAGFYIDLAVVDPERRGRYLLGIECDGATYHSARTARDRDRLRQQVLEGMGWRIHRIWSTDWFRNPERELRRVITAIEQARTIDTNAHEDSPLRTLNVETPPEVVRPITRQEPASRQETILQAVDYQIALLHLEPVENLHEVPIPRLGQWIRQVVQIEGPVHFNDVARRIVDAAQVKRIGRRIRKAFRAAVRYEVRNQRLVIDSDFLSLPGQENFTLIRSHANVSDFSRNIEHIPPQEIMLAVKMLVKNAVSMKREEVPVAVCNLLGFGRTSESMRQHVDRVISMMIHTGQLEAQNAYLVLPSAK